VSRREKKIWMHYRAMEIEIQAINQAIAKIKANLSDVTKAVKHLSHTFEVVKQVFGEMADVAKNLETENMEPEMEPEMETEV
jgi:phage-related protein